MWTMDAVMKTYPRWDAVPDNLKTRSALKKMGLKPRRNQQPAAIKTHWHWKTPDYHLYDVAQAVPNVVTDAMRAALAKAYQRSLEKRTCSACGWIEQLSKPYRGKWYVKNGLCPHCRERLSHMEDHNAAIQWAQETLKRTDVLILDTETTGLDEPEIIELAIINLQGDVIFNGRFNPLMPITEGAAAVHGMTAEMLANEPRFVDCKFDVFVPLITAGLVLIYNAAFDVRALRYTSNLHGVDIPNFKNDCLMEWYAQFVNHWSSYHKSYRWQPLNSGHSALEDCRAALATLHEMANGELWEAA